MPDTLSELFNGGLVTARHPALLKEGELQRADDCIYREKDPAIWRAPGRTAYGTVVSGSPTLGLGYLPFENKYTSKVLAYSGVTLWSLNVADTGTETATEVSGPGSVLGATTTVTGHTTFTADSGAKPFHSSVVGARVYASALAAAGFQTVVVTAVSGTPTGAYYPAVVIKKSDGNAVTTPLAPGTFTLAFQWGVTQTLDQDATTRNNILDFAQYGSSYFGWFGFGEPRKIEWLQPPTIEGTGQNPVLTQRPLGLQPVTDAITLASLTGIIGTSTDSYAWRASLGYGYFWFLVTEINVFQEEDQYGNKRDVEVESSYLAQGGTSNTPGEPVAISVPNAASGVRIILPAVKNTGAGGRVATHWGIYMSPTPTTDASTRPSLATFRRIGRPAVKTFAAGTNTYGNAGTYEVYELINVQTVYASGTASVSGFTGWDNAAGMTGAPDGGIYAPSAKYARGSSKSGLGNAVTPATKATFTITTSGAYANREVTGIQITVYGRADSTGNNQSHSAMYLYPTNGSGKDGFIRYMDFENKPFSQQKDFGGQGDTWGVTWGVFSGLTTFGVIVAVGANDAPGTTWLDSVRLTIYGSSATIDVNGKAYRCVVYRDQIGTTIAEPAYGIPPTCSTGDFFQGMLVLNDLKDDTAIRYSLPGSPEYFPKPYVMRFNSAKRRDKVTLIRRLGQVLIVGLEFSIERINYLPREVNTDLEDGEAHEELATHGIAGPLAAAKFDLPDGGTVLAYASASGIFLTDGIKIRALNMDLDWPNTVKLTALSSCVMRVYEKEKHIELYYCPAGATHNRNTRKLVFHYGSDKIKEGGFLPCTGPITVSGRSSCEMILNGSHQILTGHETSGIIYKEDSGVAQPGSYQVHNASDTLVAAPIQPLVRSRKIAPAGITRDTREHRVFLLFSKYGSNSVTASSTTTLDSVTVTSSAAFGSVLVGMRVKGDGIDPGVIVIAKASSSSITLSRAANTSGTATLTFDTGTVAVTMRGSGIGEDVATMETGYVSTLVGDLVETHLDNSRQFIEIQIEKVVLPSGSSVDLDTNMRLHQFTLLLMDGGLEQNRSAA